MRTQGCYAQSFKLLIRRMEKLETLRSSTKPHLKSACDQFSSTVMCISCRQAFKLLVGREQRVVDKLDIVPSLPPLEGFAPVDYGRWIPANNTLLVQVMGRMEGSIAAWHCHAIVSENAMFLSPKGCGFCPLAKQQSHFLATRSVEAGGALLRCPASTAPCIARRAFATGNLGAQIQGNVCGARTSAGGHRLAKDG